jgi:hypothetical protein
MKRLALVAALALAASSPVWANEQNDGAPPVVSPSAFEPAPQVVRLPNRHRGFLGLALAQIADCATTTSILSRGGRELNPIAQLLGVRSLPLCLVARLATDLIGSRSSSYVHSATIAEGAGAVSNALELIR